MGCLDRAGVPGARVDRSTYHYKSCRPDTGQPLKQDQRYLPEVRYGYRRVHVLLRREGWLINQKSTRRIYRELGLQLHNKTPKRRVGAKLRDDRKKPSIPPRPGRSSMCMISLPPETGFVC